MAQILPESVFPAYEYRGQILWPKGTDESKAEEYAEIVKSYLTERDWEVKYQHITEVGQKQTTFELKLYASDIHPEKPQQDWDGAVKQVKGAKSVYFEPVRSNK